VSRGAELATGLNLLGFALMEVRDSREIGDG